jgi:hypothetical protein
MVAERPQRNGDSVTRWLKVEAVVEDRELDRVPLKGDHYA